MLFYMLLLFSFSYENMALWNWYFNSFAVVQLTMILMAFKHKESLTFRKIFGVFLAFFRTCIFTISKDDFFNIIFSYILMIISGIAWAFYTLLGKKSTNAFISTKDNFLKLH